MTLAPRGPFGRRCRLRTRADFARVFRGGHRRRGPHLGVVVRPRIDADTTRLGSRLGLAVSRKAGHSPARARLRRLTREAFRALRDELPRSVDVVVLASTPWPKADLAGVHSELEGLLASLPWDRLDRPPRRRRR